MPARPEPARPDAPRRFLVRLLATAGLAWGAALAARPHRVVEVLCPEYPRSRIWVVRVLGGRLLAQHAALLSAPRARLISAASGIDLLHAATMLPLLALPRYRRAALVSGGVAAVSAAVLPALAPRPTA